MEKQLENKLFISAMRRSIEAFISTQNFKFNCPIEEIISCKIKEELKLNEYNECITDEEIDSTYSYSDLLNITYRLTDLIKKTPLSKTSNFKSVEPYFKWQQQYSAFVQEHNESIFDVRGKIKENQISVVPKTVMFFDKEIEIDDHFIKTIADQQGDFLTIAEKNDHENCKDLWDVAIVDIGFIHISGGVMDVKYGSKMDEFDFIQALPNMSFLTTEKEKDVLFVNWYGLWKRLAHLEQNT